MALIRLGPRWRRCGDDAKYVRTATLQRPVFLRNCEIPVRAGWRDDDVVVRIWRARYSNRVCVCSHPARNGLGAAPAVAHRKRHGIIRVTWNDQRRNLERALAQPQLDFVSTSNAETRRERRSHQ